MDKDLEDVFELTPVVSSHIVAAGWRDKKLRIQFTSGKVCEYDHVSEAWFQAFLEAPSKGRFFVAIRKDVENHPWRTISE